jgi:hypothetical protein
METFDTSFGISASLCFMLIFTLKYCKSHVIDGSTGTLWELKIFEGHSEMLGNLHTEYEFYCFHCLLFNFFEN